MIPNNQLWFRQTSVQFPPIETGYEYIAEWINLTPPFSKRDGDVIFETNGKLRMIGGWDDPVSFPPNSTTNQQWESPDGINWTQLADAPWVPRHNFAAGYRADGFFWLWGGDGSTIPTGQRDVWKYSTATDWVQVTSDWGNVAGDRTGHSFCVHQNYMYLIGGTIFDCVRSNDGINWTKMSDLPAALVGYAQGYACSHRGSLYFLGGFAGDKNKVYKSIDGGVNWISLPDLTLSDFNPAGPKDTTAWCRLISWSDRLFYLAGASTGGNVNGMWYSEDEAQTWIQMYSFPVRQRHAPGICKSSISGTEDIWVVAGNNATDTNRIYKIPLVPISNKAMYSVRKVNPSYNGPCMKIKPIFTAAVDIGFVGNDIDTAAINTAAAGLNATVETWYDQSGNGFHLTQSDPNKQPFIYLSGGGGIQTLNGKTAINFFDNTKGFTYSSLIDCGHHYVIWAVTAPNADNRQILTNSTDNDDYGMLIQTGINAVYHKSNEAGKYYAGYINETLDVDTQYLIQAHKNRMTGMLCVNDGDLTAATSSTFERYDTGFQYDKLGRDGIPFTGKMQEVCVMAGFHNFDLSDTIKTDVNNYFGIF